MVTNRLFLLKFHRVKNQAVNTPKDLGVARTRTELYQNTLKMIQLFMRREQNLIL